MSVQPRSAHALHVGGVKPLGTCLDLELDLLSLGKRLEPFHADRGEVNEDVFAPLLLDEAVTLGIIEPFHFPFGHCDCLQQVDRFHGTGAEHAS